MQRLRDETRDLSEELNVLHKTNKEKPVNSNEMPIINSNRMQSMDVRSELDTRSSPTL